MKKIERHRGNGLRVVGRIEGILWFLAGLIAMGCLIVPAAMGQIPISSIEELQKIGNDPAYPLDGDYVLTQDIDATATPDWNDGAGFAPIGPDEDNRFTGILDGQSHVIMGLVINRPSEYSVGLFRYLENGGEIRNLGLEGGSVLGLKSAGNLVGISRGSVTSCYATGTVSAVEEAGGLVGKNRGSVTLCYAKGAVSGMYEVGGLMGRNDQGSVTLCYATGSVSGEDMAGGLAGINYESTVTSCYATGAVFGYNKVGGLVGTNHESTITSCYATGAVSDTGYYVGGLVGFNGSGTMITSCYATGAVSGELDVGGLVGWNEGGAITLCYATGTVSGTGNWTGGLVGFNGNGTITSCYATGTVSGQRGVGGLVAFNGSGVISSCFAMGSVSGHLGVGGLVWSNDVGSVTLCYWGIDATGQSSSEGGGEGRSTVDMAYPYAENTYEDWDFENTWVADTDYSLNKGYPYLRENPPSGGEGESPYHRADWNGAPDNKIDLTELLRVIQFYNSDGYHCAAPGDPMSDEGYLTGPGDTTCRPHCADYNPQDWRIDLSEVLRIIQFYNSGGYRACLNGNPPTEDGYCPGPP